MDTRQDLTRRTDVDNADIDDIIEIAAELQHDDQALADRASVKEVEDVARELDIDPAYVERAIEVLGQRRAAAETEGAERATRLTWAAATVAGVLLLILAVWFVSSQARSSRIAEADAVLSQAETQLTVVLDRQASLAPQLVALAGGDAAALTAATQALTEATTVRDKLRASEALSIRMATALGGLSNGVDTDTRLNLQHELTGTQNRITVERQRYEAARVAREEAAAGGC